MSNVSRMRLQWIVGWGNQRLPFVKQELHGVAPTSNELAFLLFVATSSYGTVRRPDVVAHMHTLDMSTGDVAGQGMPSFV